MLCLTLFRCILCIIAYWMCGSPHQLQFFQIKVQLGNRTFGLLRKVQGKAWEFQAKSIILEVLKDYQLFFLFRFRFHCILEIILNLWSLDFCKRFLRILFLGVLIYFELIMFSKLYKFSKLVMYLNSCSMDLGCDSVL